MKVISVVGSGSDSGKTTLICAILARVPGLAAVKISPRPGECRVEWGPGRPGKDTARFAAAGAVKVARIVGPRACVPGAWALVQKELDGARGVVVEGAASRHLGDERLKIFVVSPRQLAERPERNRLLIDGADLVVNFTASHPPDGHRVLFERVVGFLS